MLYKLRNTVQHYSWGSADLLPAFLGLPNPDRAPWAELWMGAHPKAPSLAETPAGPEPLDAIISSDPAAFLGEKTTKTFGGQLPFLFKVLAAASPLSIQCHPGADEARTGFKRENSGGIPPDAPRRNYRDANHKPETILALTEFTALRGLRPLEEIIRFFSALPVPELRASAEALSENTSEAGIKAFLRTLLAAPAETARRWITAAKARGRRDYESRWFSRIAEFYPEDSGCFAPFYLNLITLRPGEALFLGAGEMHAYLEGMGVELMANSDNVLRAGLTPKHIDVEELLRILNCRTGGADVLLPRSRTLEGGFIEEEYPRRADEFLLSVLRPETPKTGGSSLRGDGPEILLCGEGRAVIRAGECSCVLAKGDSVFIPAAEKTYTLGGNGVLYRARVPV
jgi:mannose-6-phosphate isomerase